MTDALRGFLFMLLPLTLAIVWGFPLWFSALALFCFIRAAQ